MPRTSDTDWVTEWFAWDALNKSRDQLGGIRQLTNDELTRVSVGDIESACVIVSEGAVIAGDAVGSFERSRRWRRGTFGKAVTVAKTLEMVLEAIRKSLPLFANISAQDWESVRSGDNVAPLAALVCTEATIWRCFGELSAIGLGMASEAVTLRLGDGISAASRSWLTTMSGLAQRLRDDAESSGEIAHLVADKLRVAATVETASGTYVKMARIARESAESEEDIALARAIETAQTAGRNRLLELGELVESRSTLDLPLMSSFEIIVDGMAACCTGLQHAHSFELEVEDVHMFNLCYEVVECALATSLSQSASIVGLVLLGDDFNLGGSELDSLQSGLKLSSVVAAVFALSALRQLAGCFEAEEAEEMLDVREKIWQAEHPIARLVGAL